MPTELLLILSGLVAGTFGAMLGLGGGLLIVPILTLGFGTPITGAVGTSLVCVIATSTGAAALNVRAGRADVRLGITLGAATVVGAASGGILAGVLPDRTLAGLFAALLAYTSYTMLRGLRGASAERHPGPEPDPTAPDGPGAPVYRTHRLPLAWAGSLVAGHASGLLGVGGGIVSVPLIRMLMGAPMRVAVATSNFMIGITAAAGAAAYLFRGEIDPRQAAPVVIGVTIGAALGAGIAARVRPAWLTGIFVVVVAYVAVRMVLRAAGLE